MVWAQSRVPRGPTSRREERSGFVHSGRHEWTSIGCSLVRKEPSLALRASPGLKVFTQAFGRGFRCPGRDASGCQYQAAASAARLESLSTRLTRGAGRLSAQGERGWRVYRVTGCPKTVEGTVPPSGSVLGLQAVAREELREPDSGSLLDDTQGNVERFSGAWAGE